MNRTSIEEKPSGERELKGENESSIHGFMRTELRRSRKSMEEENDFGEKRRESVSFRKMGVWIQE